MHNYRGHKDIVRDVAWHPSRNEILTSSWDYNVNLNWYGPKKKTHLKRPHKELNRNDPADDDEDNAVTAPPLRRSKRLAMQREAQESI